MECMLRERAWIVWAIYMESVKTFARVSLERVIQEILCAPQMKLYFGFFFLDFF